MTGSASSAPSSARRRLDWIEAGRGLAALGVVVAHFVPWTDPVNHPFLAALRPLGGMSVEFFFVLSGFIILYVHAPDIGQPRAARTYVRRRAIRILPTYWAVLALAIIVNQTVQIAWARQNLSAGYLLRQIALLPGDLMIGQAWTLRHELLFYAVFLLMILRPRVGIAAFALWMTAAFVRLAAFGLPPGFVSDGWGILLHHYNLDFVIGMGIALAARGDRLGEVIAFLVAGAAALGCVALMSPGHPVWHSLFLKMLFGAIVGTAVLASRRSGGVPRILIAGGAISYALYISHELSGTAVTGALRRIHLMPDASIVTALKLVAAVVVATLLYRLYETPVMRRLNGKRGLAATNARPRPDHSVSSRNSVFAPVELSHTLPSSMPATRPTEI